MRKEVNTMAERYALDRLSDEAYLEKADELEFALYEAYSDLLNNWVREGVITEDERQAMITKWDRWDILGAKVFDAVLGR
jgi:hypothetical protein